MLTTLLLALLAAAPAAPAADPVSSYPLQCLYAAKHEGGSLESQDHCARVDGDTLTFAAQALARMDFNADGLSPAYTHGSWRWVRPDGKSVAVVTYDNFADDFEDGLTRGPWSGGMAYYDAQLNRVITTPYDWVDRFEGGLAVVCQGCRKVPAAGGEHYYMAGGQWGAIDRQGRVVMPLRHEAASLMQDVEAARAGADTRR
ncbi:hypothetical protein KYT87_25565 [Achromobacter sp. ES-001]|uniref:WG repeat-containing protein n=1 Tax=Achromobacter sp. ES-001 TaxID=2860286 RepID=UPI001C63E6F9|nr:WG repeat-containing protein [Achromobacter sp. ES-001]QYJ20948.1 hypothetical protein KYT87_25565 [Achromobacter sp. ES-001]